MNIGIACDHAGFPLKGALIEVIKAEGHDVLDLGTNSTDSVDYPDFAEKLGWAIQTGEADRGILICGSGVGAAVAANKMRGIRAGLCHDCYSAHQSVEHDNVNVLALGARVIGTEVAKDIAHTFLQAEFSGEERHLRRLAKVAAMEAAGRTE
ncbi:MAG: ribose 5-phosphate isomerase B [Anaerolineales bacterium]